MILNIPITKAKATIAIDTEDPTQLPEAVYIEALLQGLKVILNRGTSKVTKETYPNEEELKAKAMEVALAQFELVKQQKIRFTGAKVEKASGEVMTEARRLARNLVKEALKAMGKKISHIEASEITKAANAYLGTDKGKALIEQAKSNVEARKAVVAHEEGVAPDLGIDLGSVQVSEKKKAAAEKAAAEKKAAAAARKAGKDGVTDGRTAKVKAKAKQAEATA